jgi:hypothetical protein
VFRTAKLVQGNEVNCMATGCTYDPKFFVDEFPMLLCYVSSQKFTHMPYIIMPLIVWLAFPASDIF